MTQSIPKNGKILANGIQINYLDWGGEGLNLLFLAGMGCSSHIFTSFAPRFTDRFHVLAVDRRGHGDSDYPDSGYDPDTLTEDLLQFLDALHIERVILVGHSMAVLELCHFTALHPSRVLKLVLLDAAYDDSSPDQQAVWSANPAPKMWPKWPEVEPLTLEIYTAALRRCLPSLNAIWCTALDENLRHSLKTTPEGKLVDKMSEAESVALRQTLNTYSPEFSLLHVPVLSFFCTQDPHDYISTETMDQAQQAQVFDYYHTQRQPYILRWAERFRQTVPHARVVIVPNGHHYCFIRPAEFVYREIRKFLLDA